MLSLQLRIRFKVSTLKIKQLVALPAKTVFSGRVKSVIGDTTAAAGSCGHKTGGTFFKEKVEVGCLEGKSSVGKREFRVVAPRISHWPRLGSYSSQDTPCPGNPCLMPWVVTKFIRVRKLDSNPEPMGGAGAHGRASLTRIPGAPREGPAAPAFLCPPCLATSARTTSEVLLSPKQLGDRSPSCLCFTANSRFSETGC